MRASRLSVLAVTLVTLAGCGGGSSPEAGAAPAAELPSGTIVAFAGASVPTGWTLCDGSTTSSGLRTPDLRGRFVRGATAAAADFADGGSETHTHSLGGATVRVGVDSDNDAAVSGASHTHALGAGEHLPPFVAVAYIMKD